MAIIRTKREHNYTIVSNKVYDKNQLSWQAMGLLGYLLTKPDNWQVMVAELVNVTKDTKKPTGREGIYNIINELKEKGFISVRKNSDGSTDYTVYDEPFQNPNQAEPNQGKPNQGKPNQGKPNQGKPTLVNTEYKQLLNNTNTPLPPNDENGKDDLNADAFVSANAKTHEQDDQDVLQTVGQTAGVEQSTLKTNSESKTDSSQKGNRQDGNIPRRRRADSVPCQAIADCYNEILGDRLPNVQLLNETRKRAITARWMEIKGTKAPNGKIRFESTEDGLNWFASVFRKVAMNPFWMGDNSSGFAVSFDWIFKPANFLKIIEWRPPKH